MTKGEFLKLIEDVPMDAEMATRDGKVFDFLAHDGIFSLKKGEEEHATHIIILGELA